VVDCGLYIGNECGSPGGLGPLRTGGGRWSQVSENAVVESAVQVFIPM